jgi:cytochrome c-type biogenesis protein CcmH/NrfF
VTPTRRVLAAAVAVAVLGLVAAGLWQAGRDRGGTLEQRTDAVAAELRCPTCQGQSVEMSRSEIAAAMRAEVRGQLAAGRTPEQVRDWFADRYGPAVLLDPPRRGVGMLLWLVPAALLGGGVVGTVAVVRRRAVSAAPAESGPVPARFAVPGRLVAPAWGVGLVVLLVAGAAAWSMVQSAGPSAATPPAAGAAPADNGPSGADSAAVAAGEQAVADRPADPDAWVALGGALEAERAYGRAAEAYRTAVQLRPADRRTEVRLGLVLLQDGQAAAAESVAREILAGDPAQPEGLLVLGLAQRARNLPEARQTLQRFLDTAPTHPAAARVQRLLDEPAPG